MPVKLIDRIRLPPREVFHREYVVPRRPVIITNLFEGQPIERINTPEAAEKELGGVPLEIQSEYSTVATGRGNALMRATTVRDYLRFVEENPDTPLMCTEYATPARIAAQFRLPDLCTQDARVLELPEILNLPKRWGDHDLLSNTFFGNKGNFAHTHYDGDHRQVILYQVFGRKRVMLFQPPAGSKLGITDSFMQGFGGVEIERMTEQQKSELVDYAEGYEAVLEPGEAVYMPMLIWHYLEYLDTGMSVNLRFGRTRYGRFLCIDNFHRDYFIQNVSAKFTDEATVEAKYLGALEQIRQAFIKNGQSRGEKMRAIRSLFRRLCAELVPEAEPDRHCSAAQEERELAQIEAELELGVRYSNDVAADRLSGGISGPITPAQIRAIRGRLPELGYPAGAFDRVIYNKFAKASLESLNRTEAALLIRGFASPGAVWGTS